MSISHASVVQVRHKLTQSSPWRNHGLCGGSKPLRLVCPEQEISRSESDKAKIAPLFGKTVYIKKKEERERERENIFLVLKYRISELRRVEETPDRVI